MNLKEFIDPPKQYRPSPFWTWNGEMEPAEIETQIRDIKKKGFGGFVMHPGSGLKTAYMSDDWTKAVRRAMEVANELKIEAWLYDEDRYPSGYSGGKTIENHEENLPMALTWEKDASSLDDGILKKALAFTMKNDDGSVELLTKKPGELSGIGVFYERRYSRGVPWFNGENYADLLNPEAVKTFIDNTHEKYSKLFRYDFGEFMPGIFTDSPQVNRSKSFFASDDQTRFSFPWTAGFADYFKKLHGYSPIEHLHHLISDSDEGFKFRHDFWLAVNERFLEAFTISISSWCKEHELLFTGNYPSENDLFNMVSSGGSVMAHYEYMDIPGVNCPGSPTGNLRALKQASSVASQLGKKRTTCRIFGSSGYAVSFEDMKCNADFIYATGINFLNPQHVQYSLLGDRKIDNPPTISYHQAYWEKIGVLNNYLARCSWAVSQGYDTASVLVMAPITAAYGACDIYSGKDGEILKSIEHSYDAIVNELFAEHIAFDIGEERIIARYGSVSGNTLKVGNAEYACVILPNSLTWKSSTLDLLDSFTGKIIIMGDVPGRVDGAIDDRFSALASRKNVKKIPDKPSKAIKAVISALGRDISVTLDDGSEARSVMVNHRIDAEAHILFLANTDRKEEIDINIKLKAKGGVVELDPLTGHAYRYNAENKSGRTTIKTSLMPAGSRIFL